MKNSNLKLTARKFLVVAICLAFLLPQDSRATIILDYGTGTIWDFTKSTISPKDFFNPPPGSPIGGRWPKPLGTFNRCQKLLPGPAPASASSCVCAIGVGIVLAGGMVVCLIAGGDEYVTFVNEANEADKAGGIVPGSWNSSIPAHKFP